MFRIFLLYFLGYYVTVSNAAVAPFITPCKLDDEKCLVSSAQAAIGPITDGIKALGVETTDPLHVPTINADFEDLKLTFNEVDVAGPSKCKFLSVHVTDLSLLSFDIECPIVATGKYIAGGKVFFIPIEGNGNFEIKTEKIKLVVKCVLTIIDGGDGKKHWHVESCEDTVHPEEKVHIHMENLFNGNEEKAKAMNQIFDASWKELVLTIGKPIIDEIIHKAKTTMNQFLLAEPADELYIA